MNVNKNDSMVVGCAVVTLTGVQVKSRSGCEPTGAVLCAMVMALRFVSVVA